MAGSSLASKSRKGFLSPINRSGGISYKSSIGKNQNVNLDRSPPVDHGFEFKDCNIGPDPPACDIPENYGFEMDDRYSDPGDLDDEDHPWKPLNPYEPGNLRVKPFKKVKSFRRQGINSTKRISITIQFPLGRMHGTISSELNDIWEARHHASERQESQSPSKYEKCSGASPNVTATTQFVRAEMLPSGYFIRPCKGGESIIRKVDMLVWISCQAS
ncbi:unnamed protein product [Camellia sinensis]